VIEAAGAAATPLSRASFDSVGAGGRVAALFGTRTLDGFGQFGRGEQAAMGAADVERGHVLLLGRSAGLARAVASVVPTDVEVVAAAPWTPAGPGDPPITRAVVGEALPFFEGSFAGVAVHGSEADRPLLREAGRVLARGHRVVVVDPPDDAQVRFGAAGLTRFVGGSRVAAAGR